MKESDIVFESGNWWISKTKDYYKVHKNIGTHSTIEAMYNRTIDGLSNALYYCQYKSIVSQRPSSQKCLELAKNLHK